MSCCSAIGNSDAQLQQDHLPFLSLRRLLETAYAERRSCIRSRLEEFALVGTEPESTFYELCYCLCTPGTKARHAIAVMTELRQRCFYHRPIPAAQLEAILRMPSHYIRFHRTKARRLAKLHSIFPTVWQILYRDTPASERRRCLVDLVEGLGMKEASHFLRNTGVRVIAVLDRHVIFWMQQFGFPVRLPRNATEYEQTEALFFRFAEQLAILPEELDLLLWSLSTGEVLR